MINDLKLGFRAIKHALNLNGNLISMVLFLLLGCAIEFITPNQPLGGMYIALVSMMIVQCIQSVTVSAIVQTSPYKKRLQTSVPAIIGAIGIFVLDTVMIGLKILGAHIQPFGMEVTTAAVSNAILFSGGLMIILMLYTGAAFKVFWPSTIIFTVAFMVFYGVAMKQAFDIEMIVPLWVAILINYLMVLVGCILEYLLFLLTYKLDYSKVTWEAALKRAK